MSDIGTGAESAVNDAVNSAANATDGPFAVYVRKARPNMREASTLQGGALENRHSNGIADPLRMV